MAKQWTEMRFFAICFCSDEQRSSDNVEKEFGLIWKMNIYDRLVDEFNNKNISNWILPLSELVRFYRAYSR